MVFKFRTLAGKGPSMVLFRHCKIRCVRQFNQRVSFRRQLLQRGRAGGRGPRAGQESSQQTARATPHSAQLPHQVSSIIIIVSSIPVTSIITVITILITASSISVIVCEADLYILKLYMGSLVYLVQNLTN